MVNIQLIRRHQLFNAVGVRKTPFPLFRKNKFKTNILFINNLTARFDLKLFQSKFSIDYIFIKTKFQSCFPKVVS